MNKKLLAVGSIVPALATLGAQFVVSSGDVDNLG
jgi:hypothetical protein